MRAIVLALALMLFPGAAYAASYAPPPNAPQVFVDAHGVTVGVWAAQTAVGHGIGIFERSGSGAWTLCGTCMIDAEIPTMDIAVSSMGGPGPYIESKRAAINAKLSARYPSVMPEPTGTTMERVNQTLSGFVLRMVNGVPAIGPR